MEHSGILYFKFQLPDHEHLLPSLVDCYRKVFAAAPWSEWKKCGKCGMSWGIEQNEALAELNFQHCGQLVDDFWGTEDVTQNIRHDVSPDASCWLAANKDGVVGFTWGFPISPADLAKKLEIAGLQEIVHEHFDNTAQVAYMAEMGVLPQFRGSSLKVAKQLARHRLADFKSQGLEVGVVRTKTNPPSKTYIQYTNEGYKVIYEYRDQGGRVIQAREFAGYDLRAS